MATDANDDLDIELIRYESRTLGKFVAIFSAEFEDWYFEELSRQASHGEVPRYVLDFCENGTCEVEPIGGDDADADADEDEDGGRVVEVVCEGKRYRITFA